jgi:enterochelin esterase-like enzyme
MVRIARAEGQVKRRTLLAIAVALLAGVSGLLDAQGRGGAPGGGRGGGARARGTVERITVHGMALMGNGESPDRNVTIYLPPTYGQDQARRYPVLYLLHGTSARDDMFTAPAVALAEVADALSPVQGFSDLIIVTPDASTINKGGMYASGPAAGDWERFIADDLVGHIDGNYRTLAQRMSRGLAGHGAGADGALRIGLKRADVFSSLYFMSATVAPIDLIDKNAATLESYYAVAMDVGTADPLLPANRQLHEAMTRLRIAHGYEEYDGDHASRLRDRFERSVLLFFSKNLAAPANPSSPPPQR